MTFTITKIAPNNFSHFDGFKEMNFSNWEINFNNTTNTIILQLRNGAPFPKKEVLASEVIIKDGIDGTPETFSTTEQIRTRLLALNYNPLQSSVVGSAEWGGIGGDIENQTDLIEKLDEKEFTLVEGTNITIDRTNPLAPIISAEGGGAVDSVNGQTGVVVLDADDIGAIPLSGTTAGNPITGDLSYDTLDAVQRNIKFIDADENENYIYFGNDTSNPDLSGNFGLYSKNNDGFSDFNFGQNEWKVKQGDFTNSVYFDSVGFVFLSDAPTARGFVGSIDYTPNITDLDYTQKKYVDTKAPIETPATTGVSLTFATDRIYGSIATPETGNITASVTGAKLGVTNIIIHNSGTAPTFDSKFKKLSGSGSYVVSVVNYIYCTYITPTEIIYSINQRT